MMTNTHHHLVFLSWCSVWAWRKPGIKSWLRPEATIPKNSQKPPKNTPKTSKIDPQNLQNLQKRPKNTKKGSIQFLTRPPLKRLRNFWGGVQFLPTDRQKVSKNDPKSVKKDLPKPPKSQKRPKKGQNLPKPPKKTSAKTPEDFLRDFHSEDPLLTPTESPNPHTLFIYIYMVGCFWGGGVFGILRERVLGIPRKKWPLAVANMFNSGLSPCPHTTPT